MKKFFLLIILILFNVLVNAEIKETFLGFSSGMTLEEVTKVVGINNIKQKGTDGIYMVTKEVTQTNPFEKLSLLISKDFGLIRIIAFTNIKDTNIYGDTLVSDFSDINDMLNKKYEKGVKLSSLKEGSIWDEPKDFTNALLKKERVLGWYWLEEVEKNQKYKDLESIGLDVWMISQTRYYLSLKYELKNYGLFVHVFKSIKEKEMDL